MANAQVETPAADPTPSGAPKQTSIYRSKFDKSIEVGTWSDARSGKAPNGRRLLGLYGVRETLYQHVRKLPEHRYVRVRLDLVVAMTWDGDSERWGPDTWAMNVKGGPQLILTSFCNKQNVLKAEFNDPGLQAYPDEFPFGQHKADTGGSPDGAALGFKFHGEVNTVDSIYKIDVVFPHTGEELVLQYSGFLDNGVEDEGWGIDAVKIDVLDGETPQNEEQLAALWKQIAGKDPVAANTARWKVIAAGPQAAEIIAKNWQVLKKGEDDSSEPEDKALRARFEAILTSLTSDDFVTRKKARADLGALGASSLPMIEKEWKDSKDPEVLRALQAAMVEMGEAFAHSEEQVHLNLVGSRVDHIARIFQTHANDYKITSSVNKIEFPHDPIGAAADGYFPKVSGTQDVPRFTWNPNKGTEEWLQYDFPKAKTISEAEVFWYEPSKDISMLPKSWKLLYKADDDSWKAVEHKGEYPIAPDKMNKVTFKPVQTKAVRLVVQLPNGEGGGVYEFRVSNEEKK